jgi:hypothetical protein
MSREERQTGRTENQGERQATRDERQGDRPANRQDRRQNIQDSSLGEYAAARGLQENRQDYISDMYDQHWDNWNDYYHDNHYYYDHHYYPATTFVVIPIPIMVGTTTYYSSNDQWYTQVSNQGETGYVKISTPAGYEVTALPAGYKTITASGQTYYYINNGTFYMSKQRDGKNVYVVVNPPFGIEVTELPKDAVAVKVEGRTYYQYDLVYYRKVTDEGRTTYVIVASPFYKK